MEIYEKYKSLADKEENIIFCGNRYFDMDKVIENTLDLTQKSH